MTLPLQENMNSDDPVEHVVWALVNMGGMMDAPMIVPPSLLRTWARHIYDAGFRHHPDKQMIFYIPPSGDEGLIGMGGQWVPADEPGVTPELVLSAREQLSVDEAIAQMTPAQKQQLIDKLQGGRADGGFK